MKLRRRRHLIHRIMSHSVSRWLGSLKAGDSAAAQKLWDRYRLQLVELATLKLRNVPRRIADEEDVAQSVFYCLWSGAIAGRFDGVKDRDDLWWLLLAITKQKAIDLLRREMAQKRGGGQVITESACVNEGGRAGEFSLDQLIGDDPTPEFLVMLEEQTQRLLGSLRDDRLRRIAKARIEGFSTQEIASQLAVSSRMVERKLQLIRTAWTEDLINEERDGIAN